MLKHWARIRKHGPCMIFDWHETEDIARQAIENCATSKLGKEDVVRKIQTVAFFPDGHKDDSVKKSKKDEVFS